MTTQNDPTPGEISRRFDDVSLQLRAMADAIAKLPTAELVATQQGRIVDRVSQVERDTTRVADRLDQLTKSLEAERDARVAAITAERAARVQDLTDERTARSAEIAAEKTRIGVWVRWGLAGIVMALGSVIAQALGLHVHVG